MIFLGKAIPKLVKTRGKQLVEQFPEKFGTVYEENKQELMKMGFPFSKVDLHLIAAYITRLVKKQKVSAV